MVSDVELEVSRALCFPTANPCDRSERSTFTL